MKRDALDPYNQSPISKIKPKTNKDEKTYEVLHPYRITVKINHIFKHVRRNIGKSSANSVRLEVPYMWSTCPQHILHKGHL